MKILLATGIYPPEIGGPATYAYLLAQELPKRGIQVEVLPFRTVRHLPRVARHIVYFFKILRRARSADVIFTQDPVSTGLPAVCAGKISGKKTVLRVAGDYAWEQSRQRYGLTDTIDEFQGKHYGGAVGFLRGIQRFSVRHADVVITPSRYFNRLVSGWTAGRGAVSPVKVLTIYNGIGLALDFEKLPKFEQKTIITAGRLVPWKGFDTLISLLPKLKGWRLKIAGDGPDKQRLASLAGRTGVLDRIDFLGTIERPKLFSEIYRSHLFALLSTFESFSFQTVEAMHVGVPVIAARIGNLEEIIDDGRNGLLIDPKDEGRFVELAEKILSDQVFAAGLAKEAQRKAAEFSVDRLVESLSRLFAEQSNEK